jgi:hypothetical protein
MLKMAVGQTEELDGGLAANELLAQCAPGLEGTPLRPGWCWHPTIWTSRTSSPRPSVHVGQGLRLHPSFGDSPV